MKLCTAPVFSVMQAAGYSLQPNAVNSCLIWAAEMAFHRYHQEIEKKVETEWKVVESREVGYFRNLYRAVGGGDILKKIQLGPRFQFSLYWHTRAALSLKHIVEASI
jgi:hypothetical protein